MEYLIHADDFGLTEGITDGILGCFDHGPLTGTSIVANGYAFDYAVSEVQRRPGLRLAVHLNLAEGRPVSREAGVAPLLDADRQFHLSFPALWLRFLRAGPSGRLALRDAVKHELAAQIGKVREAVGEDVPVRVDSHQHYHMIPFVFDALLDLSDQCRISYVRLPRELFFWCGEGQRAWANYAGANLVKHLLLNGLCRRRERRLMELGIRYCHTFVGVLFTGNMSEAAVRAAAAQVPRHDCDGVVEVLFHPGGARPDEEALWAGRPELARYYLSPWRAREREALMSPSLRGLVDSLRAASS